MTFNFAPVQIDLTHPKTSLNCHYCGRPCLVGFLFRGDFYHALEDETGRQVNVEQTCWRKCNYGMFTITNRN